MRVLIIGPGSIGRRHISNLLEIDSDTEFIVVRRPGHTAPVPECPSALVLDDVTKAIDLKPNAAVICTPSSLHVEAVIALLQAGIPSYIEKPVVGSARDLERVRLALAHLDLRPVTFTGCNLRYLPSLVEMRSLLSRGVIGNVVRAWFQAGQWLPDWRPAADFRASYSASARLGGGVILDLVHELDAARWLLGEFTIVKALAGRFSSLEIESEDTACILLGRENGGPIAGIGLDYVSRAAVRVYEIVGEEGTLRWDLGGKRLELFTPRGRDLLDCGPEGFDVGKTYLAAMRDFLHSVRERQPMACDLTEGLKSSELAIRAKESAVS